ncbi:MAG: hypothetical protein JOZ69_12755 [Myxococcales bacterium]|nr:hypothetical protein [Myxococcales bacterium]
MLWAAATREGAAPGLALVYGRAVETARDLSAASRAERARSAYERVLEAWPESWEAALAHAVFAGVRRGRDEAGLEILRDLDALRARGRAPASPVLDAFEALKSGREHLFDRARAALERARGPLAGTALFADAEDAASPRSGGERVAQACDPGARAGKSSLDCLHALRDTGDRAGEARELARLRALLGAPGRFLPLELRDALAAGDDASAHRAYDAMLPAERTLGAVALLEHPPGTPEWLGYAQTARDAPAAIGPLLRATGDDPTRPFEGVGERLADQDRRDPILPSAATAVLAHLERYDVAPSGLVHWTLFDVRRVSGTTDVEVNAQAQLPDVWGRSASRALHRRIWKRDGRVLEPDPTPRASQAHADLSQLEQGDVVEALYEGFALPSDTGDVGIDTPDLLPDRTAVHDATVELRLPPRLRGALWSHPLLGTAAERAEGGARVLTWHLADVPVRRVEDGVPRMDRSADVSFSTATWSGVGRALGETVAALAEHDPEIAAWAREAAGPNAGRKTRATVEALVTAAGRDLRESDPGMLSDYGGGIAPSQTRTARSFLSSHDGSRTWLILRSLRELGVPCDLVVAENEPFSADPSFPPHFGRFAHPLLVARVAGAAVATDAAGAPDATEAIWIDADVQGPPLPAGHVSPELRGRLALRTDGTIAPLPAFPGDAERDEVDVRLALDEHGSARGTFAILLRGREAQDLSEAFLHVVGADRQRVLREVVLGWLPWADVDDVQLSSSEGSFQVSLRAEVSVGGYAQPAPKAAWLLPGLDTLHASFPRARVSSLGATFATRARRESALALSRAVQYHLHRRIELPPGARVARLPGPVNVRSKLVEATRSIAVDTATAPPPADGPATHEEPRGTDGEAVGRAKGGAARQVIEDDFVLGVATGTVLAQDYDAFVGVTHTADDGFLASTLVTRP